MENNKFELQQGFSDNSEEGEKPPVEGIEVKDIIEIEDNEKQKNTIRDYVDRALEEFENSNKTDNDFQKTLDTILDLKIDISREEKKEGGEKSKTGIYRYLNNIDRALSQEQVNKIMEISEEWGSGMAREEQNIFQRKNLYLISFFSTGSKNSKEDDTIMDLTAKSLAERIEKGDRLPLFLQEEIKIWSQNIQMIQKDIRIDFLTAVLDNPGKVGQEVRWDALSSMGLYGSSFVHNLESHLNDQNTVKSLKVINILDHLNRMGFQPGFEDSGEEALRILNEKKNEIENYFVQNKIKQVLKEPLEDHQEKEKRLILKANWEKLLDSNGFYNCIAPVLKGKSQEEISKMDPTDNTVITDEEVESIFNLFRENVPDFFYWMQRGELKSKYDSEEMRQKYNIKPILSEQNYQADKITQESYYTKVNDKYGVIYAPDGEKIDSFFKLDSKPERINLFEILKEEGLKEEEIGEQEFNKLLLTYRSLIELPFRGRIENEFNINLADYSIREQVQFVNFLSTKTFEEVERVKFFLGQSENDDEVKNRIRSFLSLESQEISGEEILKIGDELEDDPDTSRKLFSKFSQMIDNAEESAEEVVRIYEELYFNFNVDKDKLKNLILNKAAGLLRRVSLELQGNDNNKKETVDQVIKELDREEKVQKQALRDLLEMNKKVKKAKSVVMEEADDGNDYDLFSRIYGDPDKYERPEDLGEAVRSGEIVSWWTRPSKKNEKEKKEMMEKMDSWVIGYVIDKLENQISEEITRYKKDGYYDLEEDSDPTNKSGFEKHKKNIEEKKNKIEILNNFKQVQQGLENQLDRFVYGITELEEEDQSVTDRVFSRYHELINQALKGKRDILEMFKDSKQIDDRELERISDRILEKARSLLEEFSQKMINEQGINEEEVLEELDSYNSDMILTLSVLATLKNDFKRGDVKAEDIRGVSFEQKTVSELNNYGELNDYIEQIFNKDKDHPKIPASSLKGHLREGASSDEDEKNRKRLEEIMEMADVYKENYKDKPKLRSKLLKDFSKLLEKENSTTLYTLKKNKEILAFGRFTELKKGKKEFGAFNVPESLHGSAVGKSFLKSALEQEAQNNDIYGACDPDSMISSYYIDGNKGKFVVTEVISNYAETGNTIFSLYRPKQGKEGEREYKYFSLSSKQIIREYEDNMGKDQISNNNSLILKFEKGSQEFKDKCSSLVNDEGYVITNYVIDEENKKVYVALEK